jgi:NADH:ubiquinone oxidoreductase subunit C
LIFKYILQSTKQVFLKNKTINKKTTSLLINSSKLYFLTFHIKLSTFFYSTQLIDIFAYESVLAQNKIKQDPFSFANDTSAVVVYNFNTIKNNARFLIFVTLAHKSFFFKNLKKNDFLLSITELFFNAN